jgi:hypothetical protein
MRILSLALLALAAVALASAQAPKSAFPDNAALTELIKAF